jgi:hypothetical protein
MTWPAPDPTSWVARRSPTLVGVFEYHLLNDPQLVASLDQLYPVGTTNNYHRKAAA